MKPEYAGRVGSKVPRSRRQLLKLLFYTIFLILIIEAGRVFFGIWITKPVVAQWGIIEKGCWVEVLFLRNETSIISPGEGSFINKVEPGTRVSRGTVLGYLTSGFGITPKLNDADLVMVQKYGALVSEERSLGTEYRRNAAEILNKQREMKRVPETASKIKEDLASLQQEKGQILRNIKNTRAKILKMRINLKNRLNGMELITATEAGYVYFQYDDWEGKLKPDQVYALTEDEFQVNFNPKSPGNKLKNGTVIGKIINPFDQLAAVILDHKLIGTPELNDTWWFKRPDGLHSVKVRNIIPLTNGRMIVALDDNGISQFYMPQRRAKIFLIYRKVSGVIIPTQAIYKQKHQTVVKLRKGDGYRLQEVQVLETDGDRAVIEGIDFGSTIISR